MKVLKVLGILVGMLALAAFVFWFGWLRAPEGAEVCENVVRVMTKDGPSLGDKLKAELAKDCERRAKPPEFGRVPWVKRMKCMRDADTRQALEACERGG